MRSTGWPPGGAENGVLRIREVREAQGTRAKFMVLHDGQITFEGSAGELRGSHDAYLREFLYLTLPPW
jgi:ABC-type transporter Mla maintaining outer membrane lipid asymmetry ATPase subunit MlaF